MKKFIWMLALALAALVTVNSAHAAGTGMPMMEGLKNPTELATLVEKSLKGDPTGKKLLDPARCKKNGSCATAYDYFYGIRLAHPSANLGNIAELPRYLQSLRSDPAPDGKWHLSRLLVRGEQHTYDAKGWTRTFFSGETVWSDRNTSERILAGDCGNVIGQLVDVPPPSPALSPLVASALPAPPSVVSTVSTAPVFTTSACPNGFTLIANAWSLGTLGGLRGEAEKLIQTANERDSHEAMKLDAYKPADFSRTMGGRLRSEVKTRAQISVDLQIRYLDPQKATVVRELGTIHMERGVGNFRFAEDPRAYVVEVIFPPDFVSPAMSGGEPRWRMFGYEWKDRCAMNGHGALLP